MDHVFRKSASRSDIATEVASLRWLAEAEAMGGVPVAKLLRHGETLLETRELSVGTPLAEHAREFGRGLARTHAAGAAFLGAAPPGLYPSDAVVADVPSPVTGEAQFTSWGAFFAQLRLAPLLEMASAADQFSRSQRDMVWSVIRRIDGGEFDSPQPRAVAEAGSPGPGGRPSAARIHGDLWGGNIVWAAQDDAVTGTLIDPSAHGGHAETDLAALAVFGSPHLSHTVEGYREESPIAAGWEERVAIHQLHMLLLHVVKFGSGYVRWTVDAAASYK